MAIAKTTVPHLLLAMARTSAQMKTPSNNAVILVLDMCQHNRHLGSITKSDENTIRSTHMCSSNVKLLFGS